MENVSLNNKVIIYSPFHFKNTTITIESNKLFNSIKSTGLQVNHTH